MIYDTMKKIFRRQNQRQICFNSKNGAIKNASRKRCNIIKNISQIQIFFLKKSFKQPLKTFLLPPFNLSANTP